MPGQESIRRQLGDALAELRQRTGLTGREFGAALGWSQPKVSRAESGTNVPPLSDIERWLDFCEATPADRRGVLLLARSATERWTTLPDDAPAVLSYDGQTVPSLLQTPDYARFVLLTTGAATPVTAAAAVAARVQTQGTVSDGSRRIHALVTETALTWQPGSTAILVEQLHHLGRLADLPNVRLGLISAAQQRLAPASTSFTLMQWPDGPASVTTTTPAGPLLITRSGDVDCYLDMFERQEAVAVYGEQASDLLQHIAGALA